ATYTDPRRRRPGARVCVYVAYKPPHRLLENGTHIAIAPGVLEMAEREVKHAASAIGAHPGERKVAVGTIDALRVQIDGSPIECHQHAHVRPREVAELVELVDDMKVGADRAKAGELRIFNIDTSILRPGVAVKDATDQIAVFGPSIERIGRAVRTAEALALSH